MVGVSKATIFHLYWAFVLTAKPSTVTAAGEQMTGAGEGFSVRHQSTEYVYGKPDFGVKGVKTAGEDCQSAQLRTPPV